LQAETSLYQRFLALVKQYQLMNLSLLVIPSTAYDANSTENPETSGEKAQTETSENPESSTEEKSSSSTTDKVASKQSAKSISSNSNNSTLKKPTKSTEDDDEFRRDRFATPVTATRIDHGIKDVLGGGRGTLGRGKGKGIRKALFAVDVPAEEDEDEVDTHVEHVGVPSGSEDADAKALSGQKTTEHSPVNGISTNGTKAKGDTSKDSELEKTAPVPKETKKDDEEQREEPITTADGIEFNV
jgi:hypothetical protein